MSDRTAKALVTGSMLAVLALIGVRRNQLGDPFRNVWAAGVLWILLSLLTDVAPEVGGPLAVLVLIYAVDRIGKGKGLTSGQSAKVEQSAQSAGSRLFGQLPSF